MWRAIITYNDGSTKEVKCQTAHRETNYIALKDWKERVKVTKFLWWKEEIRTNDLIRCQVIPYHTIKDLTLIWEEE